MTWWHWVVLGLLLWCAHYLQKIRDLLGWLMLLESHREPQNRVGANFREEHEEKMKLKMRRPFTWWLIWFWRNN